MCRVTLNPRICQNRPVSPSRQPFTGPIFAIGAALVFLLVLTACDPAPEPESDIRFRWSGTVESSLLDEISGIQESQRYPGVLWVHNDDGEPRIHAISASGEDLGSVLVTDAVNVDWEDITLIPGVDSDLLVLADIGDNDAERSRVWLYLAREPQPDENGRFSGETPALNWISLSYPDGPRDAESIAWDLPRERLLIMSKRDQPPRLYALDGFVALEEREAELSFLAEVNSLRPPTENDVRVFGERTPFISQPTGFDLSPDGSQAVIISYRSLYLYDAPADGDWSAGLNSKPLEILGPPRRNEEAVAFHADGRGIWVSAEGDRAPVYEFVFTGPTEGQQTIPTDSEP